MLSPTPDSLSGGYAPSEPARPNSANRQHASGERSTKPHRFDRHPDGGFDENPGVRPSVRQFVAYAAPWEPIPDDGLPRYLESRHKPR